MDTLASIPYTQIELHWDHPLPGPAEARIRQLRGALAKRFRADSAFHQRDAEGRQIYRYPPIQYRWHKGIALLAGWHQAAETLSNLPWPDLSLTLGDDPVCVTDAVITCRTARFGIDARLHHYRLQSPVLLFNQETYPRYTALEAGERHHEQDRLLTAQLLTALRALGVEVPVHLYATLVDPRPRRIRFKQQPLLGLGGRLITNAVLPDGLGIGHATSHGFGWIGPWAHEP
jgi:hypothetical protein